MAPLEHPLLRRAAATLLAAVALSAGTAPFTTPLTAQGTTQKPPVPIAGVEVVATRLPEAPHDVPASIEVISGQQLRDRGVATLRDALSMAAGISIAPGGDQGPAGAVPEIWGLREFDAFLLVVDEIPWGGAFNPAVTSLSLRDVERIEILRGSAPVTYGATSFVGVIHVVHRAAAAKATYLSATGGTYGSGGLAADFVLPTKGNWNARGSVDLNHQGYKDDRTANSTAHALLRASRTAADRKLWFTADVNVLGQDPASPTPREGPVLSSKTPLDANYNPKGAHLDEARVAVAAGFERPVFNNATWGSTASFTHSAQRIFRGFLTDLSNAPNNASGFKENIDINDVYGDTHLIWPEKSHVRLMAGADVVFAAGEAKGATFTYTAPLAGNTATAVTEPSVLDRDAESERRFMGLYGSAEWRPTTRFTLDAGVRLNMTSEKRDEGEEVTNTRPSGSVGALFSAWEKGANHVRLFANFRSTFKPAAFDFGLEEEEGEAETVLDPETATSFEGGVKLRALDGRFDVEVSAFQLDFKNLVTATVVNNQPALQNTGTTRFKGFELAADYQLPHAVFARASYSAHDAKFVDFTQEFDGVNTQLAGKRFEMSANALASAGLTLAPEAGVLAHASLNYTGDRYLNKRNTALADPFTTFDAGVGYRTGRFEFRIDGRNLGDRRDAVAESEFGDGQYYRMTPRTIAGGVTVKY